MSIKDDVSAILNEHAGAPFLFVGSGLSRRYIGLETWEGLLAKFCQGIEPFGKFKSKANGYLPRAASLLAPVFNEHWWKSKSGDNGANYDFIRDETSALRHEISQYLLEKSQADIINPDLIEEFELLKKLNVDGIITTNWDTFLERVFPDYEVYIGQTGLLFSSSLAVAEIYKVHGCASDPSSLVLTESDYNQFGDRNPYLAARLMTTFVEHPIIFLGYSVGDDNIRSIISAITKCLDEKQAAQFGQNLIFVNRLKDGEVEGASIMTNVIDGISLSCTQVKTNDFRGVYEAIISCKRKIPAKIVRYFKEQMYQLVEDGSLADKIAVANIEDLDNYKDIEFVVGVTPRDAKIGEVGYKRITLPDIFEDYFKEKSEFSSEMLLKITVPQLVGNPKHVPVFKYLRDAGIGDLTELNARTLDYCAKYREMDETETTKRARQKYAAGPQLSATKIIASNASINSKASDLLFCPVNDESIYAIEKFLRQNIDVLCWKKKKKKNRPPGCLNQIRQLACHYDKIRYGF